MDGIYSRAKSWVGGRAGSRDRFTAPEFCAASEDRVRPRGLLDPRVGAGVTTLYRWR